MDVSKSERRTAGFTLVEVTVVTAILMVVVLLIGVVVQTSMGAMRLATAKGAAADEAREVLSAMLDELQYARKNPTPPNGDTFVEVIPEGDSRLPDGAKLEIRFQLPTDDTGENFTSPITYRWINEDENDNGLLDSGEDVGVVDGLLTRQLVRISEVDTGGTTTEVVEPVAGSNDISDLDAVLNGNTLEITVASTKEVPSARSVDGSGVVMRQQTSEISGRVYLHN